MATCKSIVSIEPSALGAALQRATKAGDVREVKDILASSYRTDILLERDDKGRTALHNAVYRGEVEIARLLLREGADIEAVSTHGYTPLLMAAGCGRLTVVQLLLMAGANINAQIPFELREYDAGMTALHRAASKGSHLEVLRQLLAYRPDVSIKALMGRTVLHVAAIEGPAQAVGYILDACPPGFIHTRDERGWQALHLASRSGNSEAVEILLERGAEVDARTRARWWTPLHLATLHGHEKVVRLLTKYGADKDLDTKDGDTTLSIANERGHTKILDILYGARIRSGFRSSTNMLSPVPMSRHSSIRSQDRLVPEISTPLPRPHSAPGNHTKQDGPNVTGSHASFEAQLACISGPVANSQPQTFRYLDDVWQNRCGYMDNDPRVKVAVLDTGIDLDHEDLSQPRARSFNENRPIAADNEPIQKSRIVSRMNFCGPPDEEYNVQDTDGHGTQVAGIILRLAPQADLLIGKICEGNTKGPSAKTVAKAINWAVEQRVDLINISFGFSEVTGDVREVVSALRRAQNNPFKKAVVFAAMRNEGMLQLAAWPARDNHDAIGIHSCNDLGRVSDFTPPPVSENENFCAVGEDIPVHQLHSKGGGFCLVSGTSFATPVAVSMAALIMSFVMGKRSKKQRDGIEGHVLDSLWETSGMRRVLKTTVSGKTNSGYSFIHPHLFWKDYYAWPGSNDRQYAWQIIQGALLR